MIVAYSYREKLATKKSPNTLRSIVVLSKILNGVQPLVANDFHRCMHITSIQWIFFHQIRSSEFGEKHTPDLAWREAHSHVPYTFSNSEQCLNSFDQIHTSPISRKSPDKKVTLFQSLVPAIHTQIRHNIHYSERS